MAGSPSPFLVYDHFVGTHAARIVTINRSGSSGSIIVCSIIIIVRIIIVRIIIVRIIIVRIVIVRIIIVTIVVVMLCSTWYTSNFPGSTQFAP
ncbi:hypothetical protein RJ55_08333 [Drechmeria coniospora]|nr:hypothetical protein RJ55_08333 [Drechmeria coniospora]